MRLRHGPAGDAGGLHARPPARGARGGGRGARRLLLGVALAGALLAASACEVDVGVDVEVAENGSGTVAVGVSLDRAASDALGDLAAQLDLADLALAGWDVAGPAREADNLLWVRATKRFGSAEELPSVLAEIAGPDVFEGFQLRRRTEFAEQTWEVAGQVDPAAALPELFDTLAFNEGLRDRIREVAGDFGDDVPLYGLTVSLNIDLPGELRSGGGDFTWTALTADPPAGTATAVRMTAHEENTTAKTLRLVGLAAAALFVLALLLNVLGWWYIRRYRKRRARALMAKADSEQIPAVVTGTGASAAPEAGGVLAAGEGDDSSGAAGGAAVTGGDEIDWEEFEDLGSYEDLSGDFDDLSGDVDDLSGDFDDLSGGGTGTPADDWTASLEAGADAVPEPAAMAAPGGPVEEGESSGPAVEPPPGPDAGTGSTPLISRAFSLALPPQPADAAGATTEEAAAAPGDEADSLHEPEEVDEPEKPGEAEADDDADEGDPEEIDEPAVTIEPEAVEGPDGEPGSDDEPDVDSEPDTDDEPETDDGPDPEDQADDGPEPEDQADDDDEPDVDREPDTDDEPETDDGPDPEDQADADDEPDVDSEPDTDDEPDDDPGADDQPDADDEPGDDDPDAAVAPQAAEAATPTPPSHTLRLVVIGGWGVLFQPADPAGELLVPYLQQAGATASPAEIRESYRLATLGRLTPDELWESCGLTGEPTWTHGPYTGRMSVSAGAAEFVRSLLRRRIEVACVTNDVSDWSWRLRSWTGFEALSPWVVSSDIGIRKPDPGVFEMLRRVAEIPFANCLVIDNDVRTLDAARSLGMSTGLFGARAGDAAGAPASHPTVGDFADLLRPT